MLLSPLEFRLMPPLAMLADFAADVASAMRDFRCRRFC